MLKISKRSAELIAGHDGEMLSERNRMTKHWNLR